MGTQTVLYLRGKRRLPSLIGGRWVADLATGITAAVRPREMEAMTARASRELDHRGHLNGQERALFALHGTKQLKWHSVSTSTIQAIGARHASGRAACCRTGACYGPS